MRYKVKTKDCHLIVKAKASLGESIDGKALDAFTRVYLRGFLKAKVIKKNVVEYSGPIGVSLYERLKRPVSKRDFLFIIEQLVLAVQKIQLNNLLFDHVVLDLRNVFINDVTKEIQFLYLPATKRESKVDVIEFIESIVYSVAPADEKDAEFFSRFIYFIKAQDGFKPETIEKFIVKEDRSVVNTIKKQNAGQSGFMTSKQMHYYDHYEGQNNSADESDGEPDESKKFVSSAKESAVIKHGTKSLTAQKYTAPHVQDEEATGVLDEEATGVLDEEATGVLDEEATGVLEEETSILDDKGTEVLDDEGTTLLTTNVTVSYPTLLRILTEEKISINKPVFRLGKERSYVDYFVNNNNAVSRSHADIITRGNKYFVIDLNSKNHTYINDQMLAVQCETEIHDGDKLKLGNEEFVFLITTTKSDVDVCTCCGRKVESNANFCTNCGTRIVR